MYRTVAWLPSNNGKAGFLVWAAVEHHANIPKIPAKNPHKAFNSKSRCSEMYVRFLELGEFGGETRDLAHVAQDVLSLFGIFAEIRDLPRFSQKSLDVLLSLWTSVRICQPALSSTKHNRHSIYCLERSVMHPNRINTLTWAASILLAMACFEPVMASNLRAAFSTFPVRTSKPWDTCCAFCMATGLAPWPLRTTHRLNTLNTHTKTRLNFHANSFLKKTNLQMVLN